MKNYFEMNCCFQIVIVVAAAVWLFTTAFLMGMAFLVKDQQAAMERRAHTNAVMEKYYGNNPGNQGVTGNSAGSR